MNSLDSKPVDDVTFEQVLVLAQQLRPMDQARLVARLAPKVEWILDHVEKGFDASPPKKRLRGLLSDLGTAPSAAEIDQIQRELWTSIDEES